MCNKTYQISNHNITAKVVVNDKKVIIDAAPVLKKFLFQPLSNLLRWLGKYSEVSVHDITTEDSTLATKN